MYHVMSAGSVWITKAEKVAVTALCNQSGEAKTGVIITGLSLTATIEGIRWALS